MVSHDFAVVYYCGSVWGVVFERVQVVEVSSRLLRRRRLGAEVGLVWVKWGLLLLMGEDRAWSSASLEKEHGRERSMQIRGRKRQEQEDFRVPS